MHNYDKCDKYLLKFISEDPMHDAFATYSWGVMHSELALVDTLAPQTISGLILSLRPANERRLYFVTSSLIGWAQTYNQPCNMPVPFVYRWKTCDLYSVYSMISHVRNP